ncbi:LysE family translocator [Vibrio sp. SS-MA-C1-2]|uniref:LysE family translocator n=1 Tax=Vibrio sp. SS-MA-C1-2 TaxID=2908646 RepID=UPI001F41E768|nr:LysE family translocator [Vibrio sp. SS-MA-C1-2]UJF16915.1 LysE family translocator [Vibrio sp. SS-MA-C1-2]
MEWYLAVILFAFSSTITPGPNNIMIMSSGVNFGIKKSIPHLLGIAIGFPFMVAAVGIGFSALFTLFPQLHEIIKTVGVAYLLYLAWMIANSAASDLSVKKKHAISFTQAALFQWVNPKAWVMATGAIAAYTSINENLSWQVMMISFSFFVVAIPCVGTWLLFGSYLAKYLENIKYRTYFNRSMALLLVISILPTTIDMLKQYFS